MKAQAAPRPFRLGMFVMPIHNPAKALAQCIDEDLELAVRCDELGFDEFWDVCLSRQLDLEMGLGALPKPLQKPHPPIAIPSISRNSAGIQKAAARGFSLFSHHMISRDVLFEQWQTYRSGAAAAGREAV